MFLSDYFYLFLSNQFQQHPVPGAVFLVLLVWSAVWKGLALWRAGRRGDTAWFVALFIINTAGLLEIAYIFGFSRGETKPAHGAI